MLEVTVDRGRWLRGKGGIVSRLLNMNGEMCCLGFACLAAGLDANGIYARRCPSDLLYELSPLYELSLPDGLRLLTGPSGGNSTVCNDLMTINDGMEINDAQREELLIERGIEAGIQFSFTGGAE